MQGATTIGAFGEEVTRGAGVAIPTSALRFGYVALETPAAMARSAWRQSNWRLTRLAGRAAAFQL